MLAKLIGKIFPAVETVIDRLIPDKNKADEIKFAMQTQLLAMDESLLKSQTGIITAEAQGESWLQRNWRPVTMLTFTGLVVSHWLGFTAENLSEEEVLSLLNIVKIGLGGYVVGRSAEKIAKQWNPKDK